MEPGQKVWIKPYGRWVKGIVKFYAARAWFVKVLDRERGKEAGSYYTLGKWKKR